MPSDLPQRAQGLARGVLFWTGVALFFTTQRYLSQAPGEGGWRLALQLALPQWYLWGALTPFVLAADRRFARPLLPLRRRWLAHVPLGLLFVTVYLLLRPLLERLAGLPPLPQSFARLAGGYHWNLLVYALVVGAHGAYEAHQLAQQRALQAAALEADLAAARLAALRAQLQPHFLFNTLNAISAYVERDPRLARRMMALLGDMLRRTLDHEQAHEVTLHDELAFLECYTEIQTIRFAGRIRFLIDVPAELRAAWVPSLLLQPLVENAVEHGLAGRGGPGQVELRVRRAGDRLHITVADDGPGFEGGTSGRGGRGVGLSNAEARLLHLYGARGRLAAGSASTGGGQVAIELPWRCDD